MYVSGPILPAPLLAPIHRSAWKIPPRCLASTIPRKPRTPGSCEGLSSPSHDRTIDSQQYDGSDDPRYDGPYPRSSGGAATEANKTQEPASEDRSNDAYDDREYYPARIIPRHDRFCQCASD